MNKNNNAQQVLNLPAGYFGMVLGIIGMGFAWRYASTLWPVTRWPGESLVALAIVIWFLLTVAFAARAIRFPLVAGGVPRPEIDTGACTGCGACVAPCPVNAIERVPRDLFPSDRARFSLSMELP